MNQRFLAWYYLHIFIFDHVKCNVDQYLSPNLTFIIIFITFICITFIFITFIIILYLKSSERLKMSKLWVSNYWNPLLNSFRFLQIEISQFSLCLYFANLFLNDLRLTYKICMIQSQSSPKYVVIAHIPNVN